MSGTRAKSTKSQRESQTARRFFGDSAVEAAEPFFSPLAPGLQRKCAGCEAEGEQRIQPKLTVGEPDDRFEQEADRVAAQVVQRQPMEEEGLQKQPFEEEEELQSQPKEEIQMQPMAAKEEELQRQTVEEEQEQEERLQAKATGGSVPQVSTTVQSQINNLKGGGKPLPVSTRAFYEPRFGYDFSGIRLHTDSRAAEIAHAMKARALTVGRDVVFGAGQYSPETSTGKSLLAHELTHTIQQARDYPHIARHNIQRRPISNAEENAAIAHARANYDVMSVRIIQDITGTTMDGDFRTITAGAVSNFQTANIASIANDDGRVLQDTLDVMIQNRDAAGRRNEAIHLVTDFFNLNITSNTLSVYSDPTASRANPMPPPATFPADTTFESGNLRVIRIGAAAFTDAATLELTIRRELNRIAPAVAGPAAPAPAILNGREIRSAIWYMNNRYRDRRSIMALQGLFPGVNPTGTVDADLVQRIAEVQATTPALALTDGKVGRFTLEHFFTQLRDSDNHNAAMRLVMDFYDMPNYNNLLTVYYDPTVGASTIRNPRGPVHVRLGLALYLPFAAMVHTFRHELEHVGQHRRGILSADTREFLAEASEIISAGMEHETLFNVSTPNPLGAGNLISGFQHDVDRMITRWGNMSAVDQRTYWRTLVRARRIIRRRIARTYEPTRAADTAEWAAATPAQQAALTALLARVNAAVRPPP